MANREQLYEAIERAREARLTVDNPAFGKVFDALENEMLGRALGLDVGEDDDTRRHRLLMAINILRSLKRVFSNDAASLSALERQLDIIEGRKVAAVA